MTFMRSAKFMRQAFSLLELLVVVSIIGVFGAMLAINAPAILNAGALSRGSRVLGDSVTFARDAALSKDLSTFVVIRSSGNQSWQRIAVFSRAGDSDSWEQISQWQNLPNGAIIDDTYNPANEPWTRKPDDLRAAHAIVPPPLTQIRDGGQELDPLLDYLCIGFLPDGALLANNNVGVRVVRGRRIDGTFLIDGGSQPVDWVKLIIEKTTGRTKEIYPNQS